jgi:hypothetical protein
MTARVYFSFNYTTRQWKEGNNLVTARGRNHTSTSLDNKTHTTHRYKDNSLFWPSVIIS